MLSGFPKCTLGQSTLFFLVNKTDSVLLGLNLIAQSLDHLYIRPRFVDKISGGNALSPGSGFPE
jgi:hypothetical protein